MMWVVAEVCFFGELTTISDSATDTTLLFSNVSVHIAKHNNNLSEKVLRQTSSERV